MQLLTVALNDPDLEICMKERDPRGLDDALKVAVWAQMHLKALGGVGIATVRQVTGTHAAGQS